MRKKSGCAVEVILRIFSDHAFQICHRSGEIPQLNLRHPTAIKRIRRVRARGDGLVVTFVGAGELPFLEIQVCQLLVIPCSRVIENDGLEFADAATARENLERRAQEAKIGENFDRDVNNRTQTAAYEDDVEPVSVRAPSNKVDDGNSL